jgi:hypothetical protein
LGFDFAVAGVLHNFGKNNTMEYLKYFKVVRAYVKAKYAVSLDDLEFLLFLSPEKVFNKKRLKLAEVGMSWDPKRLDSMIRRGLIGQLREKPTALYTLTPHARHIINSVYRKLEGKEPINTSPRSNPLYAPKAPYSYKLYRRQAEDLNESIIRQRRRAQESQGTDGPQSST